MPSTTGEKRHLVVYTVIWGGREYFKNMTFASREDYSRWQHRRDEIKDTIGRINEDNPGDTALVPLSRETRNRLQSWVLLVTSFAADFGNHKVPFDIRSAMHDVQGHLSLPLMDFGPDVGGTFDDRSRSFPDQP